MNDKVFNLLISLVEKGLTIREAFKVLKIHSSDVYKAMSKEQKLKLKQTKISCSFYGSRCGYLKKTNILSDYFERKFEV